MPRAAVRQAAAVISRVACGAGGRRGVWCAASRQRDGAGCRWVQGRHAARARCVQRLGVGYKQPASLSAGLQPISGRWFADMMRSLHDRSATAGGQNGRRARARRLHCAVLTGITHRERTFARDQVKWTGNTDNQRNVRTDTARYAARARARSDFEVSTAETRAPGIIQALGTENVSKKCPSKEKCAQFSERQSLHKPFTQRYLRMEPADGFEPTTY